MGDIHLTGHWLLIIHSVYFKAHGYTLMTILSAKIAISQFIFIVHCAESWPYGFLTYRLKLSPNLDLACISVSEHQRDLGLIMAVKRLILLYNEIPTGTR